MSYINCYNDNYYTPGENLSELFQELVIKPFESPDPLTQAWLDHVKNRGFEYHRKTILEQGRTNFNEHFRGLTSKEKVLIYCLYYMPMHLFSSYHIFTKYFPPVNDKVLFIDFGCGPLTSGIAFWAAFAGHRDITYLGIDSSYDMCHKAQEINRYAPHGNKFFTNGRCVLDYNRLHQSLDDYITIGDQTQIVFNFCYFLASKTVDISDLSNCLAQIMEKYNQHKMFVIYQNPPIPEGYNLQTSKFHKNWYFLKTQLSSIFQSQITQSNTEQFSYDSLVDGLPLTFDFYFDILSYDPSGLSNDSLEWPSIF